MADVEGSRSFGITGDALWAVVADRTRLAEWVPTMRRAEPAGTEEVHLEGESHGHPYSMDRELHVDEGDRSPGSEVRLHIAVPDDRLGPSPDAAMAEIRRGMEEAFDRLAGLIGS